MPFIDVLGLSLVGENNLYSSLPTNRSFKSYRSSRPEVLCKKDVLGNFAKFTGKHPCQSLFYNKVAGLNPATLLKRGSGTVVFL